MSINIKKIIARIISSFIPNKELRKKIRSRIIFFNTPYNNLPIDIKLDVVSDLDRENAINKINDFKNTLNTIDTNKYRIVSLGINCFVRTTLQGYGLLTKPANCIDGTEGDGHPGSLVFDLISTPIDCINQLLENNFEGYFDDLVFIEKHKWWRNTKYGFDFAHDLDCDNSEEGKVKLINRYKQRMQRFEKVFNTDQELKTIFLEHKRGEEAAKKESGKGLGMFLVQKLMEINGFSIYMKKLPDKEIFYNNIKYCRNLIVIDIPQKFIK